MFPRIHSTLTEEDKGQCLEVNGGPTRSQSEGFFMQWKYKGDRTSAPPVNQKNTAASRPASGNLSSNEKCHGAQPAKGNGPTKRAIAGMDWPLNLAMYVNEHPPLGPTQPHSADITARGCRPNQWSCGGQQHNDQH